MMLAWIAENVNLINMLQSSAIYFLWTAYCQSSFDLSSLGNDDLAHSVLLHFLLGDSYIMSRKRQRKPMIKTQTKVLLKTVFVKTILPIQSQLKFSVGHSLHQTTYVMM